MLVTAAATSAMTTTAAPAMAAAAMTAAPMAAPTVVTAIMPTGAAMPAMATVPATTMAMVITAAAIAAANKNRPIARVVGAVVIVARAAYREAVRINRSTVRVDGAAAESGECQCGGTQ
jgi:hypothetical protein